MIKDIQVLINKVENLEKNFSCNSYKGHGTKNFKIKKGKIPIILSAPHSILHYRNGNDKMPDMYTGSIALYLQKKTNCHLIYSSKYSKSDPNFDAKDTNKYQKALKNYIKDNDISVLIDLHGAKYDHNFAIDMGTVPKITNNNKISNSSLHNFNFISKLVQYTFEYEFNNLSCEKKKILMNSSFNAGEQNTITKFISENTNIPCIQLEINNTYRNPERPENLFHLIQGLTKIIFTLANIDWSADRIEAYRLGRSVIHKPQDKAELVACLEQTKYRNNNLSYITAYNKNDQQVRLCNVDKTDNKNIPKQIGRPSEYLLLTNRLIYQIYGKDWVNPNGNETELCGAPLILYQKKPERYQIGITKFEKSANVYFSSNLYHAKESSLSKYDYIVFNRYTDSQLYIPKEKLNYGDEGRIYEKKVMIPRYYKTLLECNYVYPYKMISIYEYDNIADTKKEFFDKCYDKIEGEIFYKLKENINDTDALNQVIQRHVDLKLSDTIEIIAIPKTLKSNKSLIKKIIDLFSNIPIWMLTKSIGKVNYSLKTVWSSQSDDANNIARVNQNMMNLLGIIENDKIIIKYIHKQVILRVLIDNDLNDYEIGLPSIARTSLAMNSVNDIVTVHRDMMHIFKRHSEEQIIAILGTILAVFQVITDFWIGLTFCLICIPLIMYLALNEERIKVR